MAVSGNLEALKLIFFLAQRQPWWRLVRFGPPNIRNVPTPLTLSILYVAVVAIEIPDYKLIYMQYNLHHTLLPVWCTKAKQLQPNYGQLLFKNLGNFF